VDSVDRGSVGGAAPAVRQCDDVLAAVAGMGASGRLREALANLPGPAQPTRADSLGAMRGRCDVCLGKKGGPDVGKTKRGKGSKLMLVTDGRGTPLADLLSSASPAEITLLERTLAKVPVLRARRPGQARGRVGRVLADAAYDSDPHRARLKRRAITLIAPHRSNRVRPATADGRSLRRLKRRWVVERTFAWLQTFRRLQTRFDHSAVSYAGFVHLACAMLTLRRVLGGF